MLRRGMPVHTTEQLNAALDGRYAIERQVGEGGMATVYLARDLRHNRRVALKVLKPDLGAIVGVERFLSEIRVTANLQHPHLLPLFDSGEAGGLLFYVMPFVEGESLRSTLDREKQLPVEEVIRIVTAIGGALDYAHRHGVIHRDLKPENILIHEGQPLVADFGIALAVSKAGGNRITQTGLSLGTPQYMSPEQATGDRTIDSRTDVYSLGAVTYEMLVGDPPHVGSTSQAIIARMLTEKPRSVRSSRPSVPGHVEAAVERALEKLPADRWTTGREFSEALAGNRSLANRDVAEAETSSLARPRGWDARSRGLLGAVVVLAVALGGVAVQSQRAAVQRPAVYDVGLADSVPISFVGGSPWGEGWTALAVSPRGDFVVYVAARGAGTELWYRSLIDTSARPLAGTAGAYNPMLSPDGAQVAYFSGKHLMITSTAGGTAVTVAEVDRPRGGEWATAELIMVADVNGTLLRGFDPITRAGRVLSNGCTLPRRLANGEIVCGAEDASSRSIGQSEDTAAHPFLVGDTNIGSPANRLTGSDFRPVDPSRLLFMGVDGSIAASRVDLATHQASRPVNLVPGVRREGFDTPGQFDMSASGTLVFVPGDNAQVAGFAKLAEGRSPEALPIPAAAHQRFDVTRDGRRMASVLFASNRTELWVYDVATGRGERWLSAYQIDEPRWDPAGERLVVRVQTEPGTPPFTILGAPGFSVAPDTLFSGGRYLSPRDFFADSLLLGLLSDGETSQPVRVDVRVRPARVDSIARGGVLSPDGRWLAYHTSSAGGNEVYVERFPSEGRRYHVSPNGGLEPLWRAPDRLLYRSGSSWYEVTIGTSGPESAVAPRLVFSDPRFIDTYRRSNALMPDGSVVYVRGSGRATGSFLRVIPRFAEEVRRRVR